VELPSATDIAKAIRADIRAELSLTASAGVAPNKFLAKIASDWRKPDGLFVIRPQDVEAFLEPLPVTRLPGVGRVNAGRLEKMGVTTVGELRGLEQGLLEARFGRFGGRLYALARGLDDHTVQPDRPTQSVSAEDTLAQDLRLSELEPTIRRMAEKAWSAAVKVGAAGRTVVLKLKTSDFRILTRSHTPAVPPQSLAELAEIALQLRERVRDDPRVRYRLVGVGLANFAVAASADVADPRQAVLFGEGSERP